MRYSVDAPLDVTVLRSGIPDTMPGRSVNLGTGGMAAVLAGELLPDIQCPSPTHRNIHSCGMVGHDPLQFHRKAEFLVVGLVAITRRYGDALASLGTTARQHRPTALGLHARTKSVRLRAVTTVGLECALRHAKTALLTG